MATVDGWSSSPLLTLTQAAAILGMSRSTVAAGVRTGQIPGRLVGQRWYIPAGELRRWLGLPPTAPIDGPARSHVRFRGQDRR
jgi:excisionase family DNA binding protein